MMLLNKVGIVTGSSRGIGRATAIEAARKGAKIVINYKEDVESAQKTLEHVEQAGSQAIIVRADVSQQDQVEKLVDTSFKRFGRIDFLVNNAGIIRDSLIENMSFEDWDAVIRTNLYGPFYIIKYAIPYLKQSKGAIVNVSSSAGKRGTFGQANYAASKSGLEALTRVAARELGRHGVRVNAVSPPFIKTDSFYRHKKKEVIEQRAVGESALGTHGDLENFANFIIYLLSDRTKNVTGKTFWFDSRMYTLK